MEQAKGWSLGRTRCLYKLHIETHIPPPLPSRTSHYCCNQRWCRRSVSHTRTRTHSGRAAPAEASGGAASVVCSRLCSRCRWERKDKSGKHLATQLKCFPSQLCCLGGVLTVQSELVNTCILLYLSHFDPPVWLWQSHSLSSQSLQILEQLLLEELYMFGVKPADVLSCVLWDLDTCL